MDWLDNLAEIIGRIESQNVVVNDNRVEEVRLAERILHQTIGGTCVYIETGIHSPFPSAGYISICGSEIEIKDTKSFMEAFKLSTNVDVYTLMDGRVKMDFAFDGLAGKMGE